MPVYKKTDEGPPRQMTCSFCRRPAIDECRFVSADPVLTKHTTDTGGVVVCNAYVCAYHAHRAPEGYLCPDHRSTLPDVPGNEPPRAA